MLGTRDWVSLMELDTEVLLDTARTRLTRTFTESECATSGIDPCPTIADE